MATATFTTVEARVDQALTNAIWADEIKDNLNQLAGAHQNLLTNGGFEVWQRGVGPFTTDVYSADRWLAATISATQTVTKETTTVDGASGAALKNVVTAFTTAANIKQGIEDYTQLRGKAVSFSCRVNQSVASLVRLDLSDSAGTTNGATSTTTGSYVTLTVTRTINASATTVTVQITFLGNGTYYLDNAMLVIGPDPAPYRPLHPQEDLARCQRYYEVTGSTAGALGFYTYGAAASSVGAWVPFAVRKGGAPTVTKNGTWTVVNCGQPSISASDASGFLLTAVVTALGAASFQVNSSDDSVTAEWNS